MKSMKNKARCFADGGKIDPDELMRQMAAKYGATGAAQVQQPVPVPQAPGCGSDRSVQQRSGSGAYRF